MNWRRVLGSLGAVLMFFALPLLVPAGGALVLDAYDTSVGPVSVPRNTIAYAASAAVSLVAGLLLRRAGADEELREREAYALVGLSWLSIAMIGGLPFLLGDLLVHPLDAFFEAMSGLTTTGYSVIPIPLEDVRPSHHLWRGLLQWIGGMGMVVLTVAFVRGLAMSGARLMSAEAPGEEVERILPRIQDTARGLWVTYGVLTATAILALTLILRFDVGLPLGTALFEAIVHGFAGIATGGFSTRSASVAAFGSPLFEIALILIMVAGGVNFVLHYNAATGRPRGRSYWRDEEFRFYLIVAASGSLLVAALLYAVPASDPIWSELGGRGALNALRGASFQFLSAVLNAGFTSASYEHWPAQARFLLLIGMFVGGCVGSTGGSLKMARVLLLLKMLRAELVRIAHPRAVVPIRLSGSPVQPRVLQRVGTFVFLYITVFAAGTLLLVLTMPISIVEAGSWAAGSLGNVGASFGGLPAGFSYAATPLVAKAGMALLMWMGRLELFTALVILHPSTWKA